MLNIVPETFNVYRYQNFTVKVLWNQKKIRYRPITAGELYPEKPLRRPLPRITNKWWHFQSAMIFIVILNNHCNYVVVMADENGSHGVEKLHTGLLSEHPNPTELVFTPHLLSRSASQPY